MRTSTKYSMIIGTILILSTLITVIVSMYLGLITKDNVVPLLTILMGSALAFFGLNQGRITLENLQQEKQQFPPIDINYPVGEEYEQ